MSGFICAHCSKNVSSVAPGTKNRNHCPFCLYSVHVDVSIGDRNSKCMGIMEPIGKMYKAAGEEVLVHKCQNCGFIRKNRIAGDDSFELVDELLVLDTLPKV